MNASGICKSSSAITEDLAWEHFYSRKIHCGVMEKTLEQTSQCQNLVLSQKTLVLYGTGLFMQVL